MSHPLTASNLSFSHAGSDKMLFKGINLDIRKGEALLLRGPNGSGKTSLCYCLCGIIPLLKTGRLEGEVWINGISTREIKVPDLSRHIGIVLQNTNAQLFLPTVEDEIAFGPENFALPREEIARRVNSCLELLAIENLRLMHPEDLSGGEKQLVALASVLSLDPGIIILDEAVSCLDAEAKSLVKDLLLKLKNEGKTLILADHGSHFLDIADSIKFLDEGCLSDRVY